MNSNLTCVAFIGCSDFDIRNGERVVKIKDILQSNFDIKVKIADSLVSFKKNQEKSFDLNLFFKDRDVQIIFDLSGGDSANSILGLIDYKAIKNSKAVYAGYSDNTVIINSIYKNSGKYSYYYNINNLIEENSFEQIEYFKKVFVNNDFSNLFSYKFLKGNKIEGIVVGGNVRCFLKLAGTKYFIDCKNKILFLESYSGNENRITSYFFQLEQIGVFKKIKGLILGTFTELERKNIKVQDICLDFLKKYNFPIVKTEDLGHNNNAKLIPIGGKIILDAI